MAIAVKIMKTPNTLCIICIFLVSQDTRARSPRPPYIIASMGRAVPEEYASVMSSAEPLNCPVSAREMTDAKMGPTHGVHTSPILKPITIPPQKPSPRACGACEARPKKRRSDNICIAGEIKAIPKIKIIIMESPRKKSAETPNDFTTAVRKSVKTVNPIINPVIIPQGLFLPPDREPDKTTGNMGNMHGDNIVTTPPRNANSNKIIMGFL